MAANFIPLLAALMAGGSLAGSYVDTSPAPVNTPYLSMAVGAFDIRDNAERDRAVDLRLEYRPDWSLYQAGILNIQPFFAAEATTDGSVGGFTGLAFDVQYHSVYVTPSLGVGAYWSGDGKNMGSPIQFRTQVEVGYEFHNQSRLGVAISHISNAGIADTNPGADLVSVYYHHPVNW